MKSGEYSKVFHLRRLVIRLIVVIASLYIAIDYLKQQQQQHRQWLFVK